MPCGGKPIEDLPSEPPHERPGASSSRTGKNILIEGDWRVMILAPKGKTRRICSHVYRAYTWEQILRVFSLRSQNQDPPVTLNKNIFSGPRTGGSRALMRRLGRQILDRFASRG